MPPISRSLRPNETESPNTWDVRAQAVRGCAEHIAWLGYPHARSAWHTPTGRQSAPVRPRERPAPSRDALTRCRRSLVGTVSLCGGGSQPIYRRPQWRGGRFELGRSWRRLWRVAIRRRRIDVLHEIEKAKQVPSKLSYVATCHPGIEGFGDRHRDHGPLDKRPFTIPGTRARKGSLRGVG